MCITNHRDPIIFKVDLSIRVIILTSLNFQIRSNWWAPLTAAFPFSLPENKWQTKFILFLLDWVRTLQHQCARTLNTMISTRTALLKLALMKSVSRNLLARYPPRKALCFKVWESLAVYIIRASNNFLLSRTIKQNPNGKSFSVKESILSNSIFSLLICKSIARLNRLCSLFHSEINRAVPLLKSKALKNQARNFSCFSRIHHLRVKGTNPFRRHTPGLSSLMNLFNKTQKVG